MPNNKNLKFYLFKFHNVFDGLIGLDNLKLLQANLDFDTGYLVTPYSKIRLLFHRIKHELNSITVAPRTEQVIRIKTSVKHGDIFIPYQKLQNCEIPSCLSVAKNGYAVTTILNKTTSPVVLDFSEPIQVENFNKKRFK